MYGLTISGFKRARHGLWPWTVAAVVLAAAITSAAIPVGDKHPGTKVAGVITAVDPQGVSILGGDGKEVTLHTAEDFSERVSVGSAVTAWYSSKDGANVLEWMDAPREIFFVPPNRIREGIRKIIILPKSDLPGANGLFDEMTHYLESHAHWYVGSRVLAEDVRNRLLRAGVAAGARRQSTLDAVDPATGEFDISRYAQGAAQTREPGQAQPRASRAPASRDSTLGSIDPSTGQFDMDRYLRAQADAQARRQSQSPAQASASHQALGQDGLIPRLASQTRVDAVLEVNVVEAQAPVNRLVARWDGAEEPIAGRGSETVARLALLAPRGTVPATTVVMRLWDAHGNLRWTNRSGLAVLAVKEGLGDKLRDRPLSEALRNRAMVDKWLATALAPLLSSVSPGKMARKQ